MIGQRRRISPERMSIAKVACRTRAGPARPDDGMSAKGDRRAHGFVAANRGDWERPESIRDDGGARAARASPGAARSRSASPQGVGRSRRRAGGSRPGRRSRYLNDLALRSHNPLRAPRASSRGRSAGSSRDPGGVAPTRARSASPRVFAESCSAGSGRRSTSRWRAIPGHSSSRDPGRLLGRGLACSLTRSCELDSHEQPPVAIARSRRITGRSGSHLAQQLIMLGAVLVLVTQYGLLPRFLPFALPHGISRSPNPARGRGRVRRLRRLAEPGRPDAPARARRRGAPGTARGGGRGAGSHRRCHRRGLDLPGRDDAGLAAGRARPVPGARLLELAGGEPPQRRRSA